MNDQTREVLLKVIAEKKQKSAQQKGWQHGQSAIGSPKNGQKRHKKGGLFDK